jgi:hypothetical protein
MARMPGARWRPLADNWATQPRMARHDLVLIHTAVGSFEGTYGYFRTGNGAGYGGTESHFMTSPAGDIDQYQDTDRQAEANGAANGRAISVENADMGAGFAPWNTNDGNAVPAFTPAQIEANARICAWAHTQHGVPLELVPDSKPGRRGIGYHRLGVVGYAVPGGEIWSSSKEKGCPGPKRIAQVPQIIARARQLVGGAKPAAPAPEDFLMALTDAEQREILNLARSLRTPLSFRPHHGKEVDDAYGHILSTRQLLLALYDRLTPGVANVKTSGDVFLAIAAARDAATVAAKGVAVDVDAEDVAEALTSTPTFVDQLAEAVADKLAARLQA